MTKILSEDSVEIDRRILLRIVILIPIILLLLIYDYNTIIYWKHQYTIKTEELTVATKYCSKRIITLTENIGLISVKYEELKNQKEVYGPDVMYECDRYRRGDKKYIIIELDSFEFLCYRMLNTSVINKTISFDHGDSMLTFNYKIKDL